MMSDHGSNRIRTVFNVNSWLAERDYLHLAEQPSYTLYSMGVTRDLLYRATSKLGIQQVAKALVPERLRNRIPDERGRVREEQKFDVVDWNQSDAIGSGHCLIYLTSDRNDPNYEGIRGKVMRELETLTYPDGNPVASAVYTGNETYSGQYLEEDRISSSIKQQGYSSSTISGWRTRSPVLIRSHGWERIRVAGCSRRSAQHSRQERSRGCPSSTSRRHCSTFTGMQSRRTWTGT